MSQESPRLTFDWLRLLGRYGLGTLLALFLVYKLSGSFELKLDALAAALERHTVDASTQTLLLRAICANTANTAADQITCREAGR